jgi:phage FluMu protein Com
MANIQGFINLYGVLGNISAGTVVRGKCPECKYVTEGLIPHKRRDIYLCRQCKTQFNLGYVFVGRKEEEVD